MHESAVAFNAVVRMHNENLDTSIGGTGVVRSLSPTDIRSYHVVDVTSV